jgi:hypothetical protein
MGSQIPNFNYENGKIYKIYNKTDVYYGSTIRTLEARLKRHEVDKTLTSSIIINNPPYCIELVENFPCDSRYTLEQRENYYISHNKCVNISGKQPIYLLNANGKTNCTVCNKEMVPTYIKKHFRDKH